MCVSALMSRDCVNACGHASAEPAPSAATGAPHNCLQGSSECVASCGGGPTALDKGPGAQGPAETASRAPHQGTKARPSPHQGNWRQYGQVWQPLLMEIRQFAQTFLRQSAVGASVSQQQYCQSRQLSAGGCHAGASRVQARAPCACLGLPHCHVLQWQSSPLLLADIAQLPWRCLVSSGVYGD